MDDGSGITGDVAPAAVADQNRRDVEAFIHTLTNDTHAAIGQQVMFDGSNNTDPAAVTRLNTLVSLAGGNSIGLIAKGRLAGKDRGFALIPEVGDEVVVCFERGDLRFPIVMGAVHGGKDKTPFDNGDGDADPNTHTDPPGRSDRWRVVNTDRHSESVRRW